jgi:hypothetical protein
MTQIPFDGSTEQNLVYALSKSRNLLGLAVPRLKTSQPSGTPKPLRHGLRAERLGLRVDQLRDYFAGALAFLQEFRPVRLSEIRLVHTLIDTAWRVDSAVAQLLLPCHPTRFDTLILHRDRLTSKLATLRVQIRRLYLCQSRTARYAAPFEACKAYLCYRELLDLTDRLIREPSPRGARRVSIRSIESMIAKPRCFAKKAKAVQRTPQFRFKKTLVRMPKRP